MQINLFGGLDGPDVITAFSGALLFYAGAAHPQGVAQSARFSGVIYYWGCGRECHPLTCILYVYLGSGNLRTSTLLKKLNNGDYACAASEFLRWVNAGGKRLPGLVLRREAEKALFEERG